MRILLSTYSGATHLSYGIVTRELWTRLGNLNKDWEIIQHGWFHENHEEVPWDIIPTKFIPNKPDGDVADRYGATTFGSVLHKVKPDIVWNLSDPYMSAYLNDFKAYSPFKLIRHVPVDGVPYPKSWASLVNNSDLLVPVTKFGSDVLAKHTGRWDQFIYHGVDTNRFKPMSKENKLKIRRNLGLPDNGIVLGFVGNHQFRKMNWVLYPIVRYLRDGAWARCKRCNRVTLADWNVAESKMGAIPSSCNYCDSTSLVQGPARNYHLWLHCFDRKGVQWVPEKMRSVWGIEECTHFTNEAEATKGIPDKNMPIVYNALDMLLMLSGGEGFGIPVAEAMACGIPVAYSDYSGHAEVAEKGGNVPIDVECYIPDKIEPFSRAVVSIADAVNKIDRMISDREVYDRCAVDNVVAANRFFSWDSIAVQWSDMILKKIDVSKSLGRGIIL